MPRILAVDDSEFICAVIRKILEAPDTQVETVNTARAGLVLAQEWGPDLLLMDVSLPDMDGFSACTALKSSKETAEIPVIFITGRDSIESVVRGFNVGAVDYINKPFNTVELQARANAHMKSKLMNDSLRLLNQSLMQALEENHRLAISDPLTGLYNRRYGLDYLETYRARPVREPSVIIMGDVDNFKRVNDCYGHHMGDHVLCRLAEILNQEIGEEGLVCRWGGEEILILLHDCGLTEALVRGSRICELISSTPFCQNGQELYCSITLGVAALDNQSAIEHLISQADEALYRGKLEGKNRCVLYNIPVFVDTRLPSGDPAQQSFE